ncbi:MAG: hypothetical protein GF353_13700 [Candidatus Lokiarchaeota archaeon]|nr:hypothetical protein [Candidatus Lokiarchaeota archaeon]
MYGKDQKDLKTLPVIQHYKGSGGGYIAAYTHDEGTGVYSVGSGIYVMGLIRLKGMYRGRIFHPEGYENQDISALQHFKEIIFELFNAPGWAGGDTGGFLGLD